MDGHSSEYPVRVPEADSPALNASMSTALPEGRRSNRWWKHALALAGLFTAACGVYANAGHGRLFFDSLLLTQDPAITSLNAAFREFYSSGPLPGQAFSKLTFAANYAWNVRRGLPGFDVFSFVVTNVVLHGLVVCLIYCLAMGLRGGERRTNGSIWGPLLAAGIFAVHPIHATSVVYIVQRRGLLATLFYLAALLACLRFVDTQRRGAKAGWALIACVAGLLCIKSKTMGITLPLAAYLLLLLSRVAQGRSIRAMLVGGLALTIFVVGGALGFLAWGGFFDFRTLTFQNVGPAGLWGPWAQFLTQLRVMAVIDGLLLLPLASRLSLDHTFTISRSILEPGVLASLVLHGVILWLAVRMVRRGWLGFSFGIFLFYLSFIPWLIVPQTEQLVEYKCYLAASGIAVALASLLNRIRSRAGMVILTTVIALAAVGLARATLERNRIFADSVSIWNDVLSKSPNHFRARVSLGVSLAEVGRYPEAVEQYRRAAVSEPYNAMLHFHMGNSLRGMGKLREAVDEFREARRISGEDLHIAVNLGNALSSLGLMKEAEDAYRSGIATAPSSVARPVLAQAYFNLANTLAGQNKVEEAEKHYRAAIEANPSYPNAYYGLALMLDQLGRSHEALEMLYAALRLNPNYKEAESAAQDILRKSGTGGE